VSPLGTLALATAAAIAVSACAGGSAERARRDADLAALRAQVDEMKKSADAESRERAKLADQLKAVDAQQAFLVAELKASKDEAARLGKALEDNDAALRDLRTGLDEAQKRAAAQTAPGSRATPSSLPRDTPPDKLYQTAMASFRAEEHGQAVLEFSELIDRFPESPLASNAQYWIGEGAYRQRDFDQALIEFRRVVDGYPKSAQVADALLKIGLCYRALKDEARAREVWEQIAKDFPGTNAATQASTLLTTSGNPAPTK